MEITRAMRAHADTQPTPTRRSSLRRYLWDGVLPEALGLCFVAIIFGGFAIAYVVSERLHREQTVLMARVESASLAAVLGDALGAAAQQGDGPAQQMLEALSRNPRIRALRWVGPEHDVRFTWPASFMPAGDALNPGADARVTTVTTAVHMPEGTPAGTLMLATAPAALHQQQTGIYWNWGVAAGVTLLVFAAVYQRLRRHLRPVAAIARNIQTFASGLEHELNTLMLSDALGEVAQGWNRLIEQLAELRGQLEHTRTASRAEDVLARFEGTVFRHIVDRLPFGVVCLGERDVLTYVNRAAAGLLRRGADALIGRTAEEVLGDATVVQAISGVRSRGGAERSVDHTRKEGEQETTLRYRIVSLSEHATADKLLVTLEDIGAVREGERARDNFLYHVTHELRTPLTNIHAYAETLTKPGFDDEQTRKECYNVIISETRRLSRLVEDILSISQLEVGTARLDAGEVDIQRLLRQIVQDNLGSADEKHIDLTLALPPKMPKIRGDKQRLAVLLNNLIGNAIKYTPKDGKAHVAVEVTERQMLISVTDTGIGISEEDQKHVFDKFYRAAADSVQMIPGTGLGLALAREVARLHGGDVEVESELGKGSKFSVALPLVVDHAEV